MLRNKSEVKYGVYLVLLIFGLTCLFSGSDWFSKPLSSAEITMRSLDCHRAGLHIYVTASNFRGDAVETACRGMSNG